MLMVKIAVMPGFAKGCLNEKIFSCSYERRPGYFMGGVYSYALLICHI